MTFEYQKLLERDPAFYTRSQSLQKRGDGKKRYVLFYDFSSLSDVDFRAGFQEHLADYAHYSEERQDILKRYNPEIWLEFYPPLVQHFVKTFIDDYMFLRFMLYLRDEELEVWLIMNTEFSEEEKTEILQCLQKCEICSSHVDLWKEGKGMFTAVKGFLEFTSRDRLIGDIKAVLRNQPRGFGADDEDDKRDDDEEDERYRDRYSCTGYGYEETPSYLVISGNDYADVFPRHTMIPVEEGVIASLNCQRACYLLFGCDGDFGHVYKKDYWDPNPRFYNARIIFLDIDGVLNRNGDDENGNYEYFNEGMVKELSRLVRMTNARIVLSSSWRGVFMNYIHGRPDGYEKMLESFMELLKREHIIIEGMTPEWGMHGGLTRPQEIRTWLSWYPEIESFVILDDDPVWRWGYLRQNVVTTMTRRTEEEIAELEKRRQIPFRTRAGLTRELADKAAEILLRKNDACIMLKD